jgi:hypothetical protein
MNFVLLGWPDRNNSGFLADAVAGRLAAGRTHNRPAVRLYGDFGFLCFAHGAGTECPTLAKNVFTAL